jgi:Icc protein
MFLAQISDMHFRSHGRKLYDFIDVNACNAEVVSQLNALEERPDAVIITGDIVNCGLASEYQVARRTLSNLHYPLYIIPGNHDDKAQFLESMGCVRCWGLTRRICTMRSMILTCACCLSTPAYPASRRAG